MSNKTFLSQGLELLLIRILVTSGKSVSPDLISNHILCMALPGALWKSGVLKEVILVLRLAGITEEQKGRRASPLGQRERPGGAGALGCGGSYLP